MNTSDTTTTASVQPENVPTLYDELLIAGVEMRNHESDLYFPDTPETRAILDRHQPEKSNAQRFTNQADPHKGERWIDVPFAFIPYWIAKQKKH